MRFVTLSTINFASLICGAIAGIWSASRGAGVWALVIQQYALGTSALILAVMSCPWKPSRPSKAARTKSMLYMGVSQVGADVLNYTNRNIDNVLIGRFVSDAALGLYAQAYKLLLLPIQQVNTPLSAVAIPVLSRLRETPARYAQAYYRAIGLITFLGMPLVYYLLVEADVIVNVLLGPQWVGTVPIFRALGVAAIFGTFNVAWGWVYASTGTTGRQLKWQIFSTPFNFLSFVLGLHWGVIGVAVAFSLTRIVLTVPSLSYCFKNTPIRLSTFLATVSKPLFSATLAAGAGYLTKLHFDGNKIEPALTAAAMFLGYIAAWLAIPGGRAQLVSITQTVAATFRAFRLRENAESPAK